jgi:hypothetical protein
MSTPQEYWDACLIKTWRKHGTLQDALSLFLSITGQRATESGVLRLPDKGIPWGVHVRVFVAQHLPKISDWLWDKPPEKDVALLKKLSVSKYDTLKTAFKSSADKELANEMRRLKTNRKRMGMRTLEYNNRGQATDWGVNKGAQSKTGGRTRRLG